MEYVFFAIGFLFYLSSLIMLINVRKKFNLPDDTSFKELLKTTDNEDLKKRLRLFVFFIR